MENAVNINTRTTSFTDHSANAAAWDNAVPGASTNLPKPEHIEELRNDAINLLENVKQFVTEAYNLDKQDAKLNNYTVGEVKSILDKVQEKGNILEREIDGIKSRAAAYGALNYNLAVVNPTGNPTIGYSYKDDPANINILLIAEQAALETIQGNSAAAKVAAEAAELLNRVLSILSALSELLAQLNEMYGTGLSAKQKDETTNSNSGSMSSTISWDDMINNAATGNGDQSPNNNYAQFFPKDKDGKDLPTRGGFLIKSSSELFGKLSGMLSGGVFNYYDKGHTKTETYWSINPKTGEREKTTIVVPDPKWEDNVSGDKLSKDGYLFVDKQTIQSIVNYVSQLVALAVPSSSGSPNGDLEANFSDAWDNNITIGSLIDASSNSTKQVQGVLSNISQVVSIFQNNAQGGGKPFDALLASIQSNLSMLGA